MKRHMCLLFVLFFALMSFNVVNAEERGFKTPEECAEALIDRLSKSDFEGFFDCFAIKEIARSVDPAKIAERYQAIIPFYLFLPPESDFNIRYNESRMYSDLYRVLYFTMVALNNPENPLLEMKSLLIKDYPYESVVDDLNGSDIFSQIKFEGLLSPEEITFFSYEGKTMADIFYSERNQNYIRKNLETYGAEENSSLAIRLQITGRDLAYLMPMDFWRVNGAWFASPIPSSNLGPLLSFNSNLWIMPYEQ